MIEIGSVGQNIRRIWFIRHGLTIWNAQQRFCGHTDIPLSAQGRVQARWLARQLRERTFATIYASDLARARETAEIIASQNLRTVLVQASPAWREIDFGAWEGLTYAEIATQCKDQLGFFTDPKHYSPLGGESLAHMQQRVWAELTTIVSKSEQGDVVIVSHGGPLRVLLCCILGIPPAKQWQLRLDPGSLSALDLLPNCESTAPQAILVSLNVQRSTRISQAAKHPGFAKRARAKAGLSDF